MSKYEEGQEILVKCKGEITTAKFMRMCEICNEWIEEGDLIGYFEDEYDTGLTIVNCLKCLEAK